MEILQINVGNLKYQLNHEADYLCPSVTLVHAITMETDFKTNFLDTESNINL